MPRISSDLASRVSCHRQYHLSHLYQYVALFDMHDSATTPSPPPSQNNVSLVICLLISISCFTQLGFRAVRLRLNNIILYHVISCQQEHDLVTSAAYIA